MIKKKSRKIKLSFPKPDLNIRVIVDHIKNNWVDIAEIKKKLTTTPSKFDIKNHGIR